eukprot:SAG22_NODE_8745_length_633_cov_0.777154_2_plen_33_part_01
MALLNVNFQLGYRYREHTRRLDAHYWSVRQLLR